ncbi:MAG: flavin reductase family protein [Chloroflexi bacterium]|nr:flavin reductase family protein [Chloroflexota bacterium]
MCASATEPRRSPCCSRPATSAVNILSSAQREIARRFAGQIPDIVDRFDGIAYSTLVTGSPLLDGALAWIDCHTARTIEAGDHTIFIGEIAAATVFDDAPLVYTIGSGEPSRP